MKEQIRDLKRDRSSSLNMNLSPLPKYSKNLWSKQIQEEEERKKAEETMKEIQRKAQL